MVTWKDFIMLPIMQHYESVLCSSSLHLLDQKYRKNCNIVKYYYNLKECFSILIYLKISFIYVMQSWIFSIITQSSVHDPSEIILICWFISILETVVLLIFLNVFIIIIINKKNWNPWYFFWFIDK